VGGGESVELADLVLAWFGETNTSGAVLMRERRAPAW